MLTSIKKRFYPPLTTLLLGIFMLAIPYAKSMDNFSISSEDDENNKSKSVCVFLDRQSFIDNLINWDSQSAEHLKKAAFNYFKKQDYFQTITEYNTQHTDFFLYDLNGEFTNDVNYETDGDDDSLQLVLIHKSKQSEYEKYAKQFVSYHMNFQHNPPFYEPVFYVHFEKEHLALKISSFKDKKGKDVIEKYFDETLDGLSINKIDSFKLVYKPFSQPIISIKPHETTKDFFTKYQKWAIVDINFRESQWNDSLIQVNDFIIEDIDDEPSYEKKSDNENNKNDAIVLIKDEEESSVEEYGKSTIRVFFDKQVYVQRLSNWIDKDTGQLKESAFTYFKNKDSFNNFNDEDVFSMNQFSLYDSKGRKLSLSNIYTCHPLHFILVHKSNNEAFLELLNDNPENITQFQHNPPSSIFYVYFKKKKATFYVNDFNACNKTAGNLIKAFFEKNNINQRKHPINSYKLFWSNGYDYSLIILWDQKIYSTIEPFEKWAIVKNNVNQWDYAFIQTDDELADDEDDDELGNNEMIPLHNHRISVFFNRKEYQVPGELRDKSVEEIMQHVVTQLPSPFNTVLPDYMNLVTSHNNRLVVKTGNNTNLNTISGKWLAVDAKTLDAFLNWKFKNNYFLNCHFDMNQLEHLRVSFEDIKNYCNIYPQCQGKIIDRERHPLYARFYNHLTSKDMGHLLEKCASQEYYDMYINWQANPIGKCPITLIIGVDNMSKFLDENQEDEEDQENENEEKEPELNKEDEKEDLRQNIFNSMQEDAVDANEFHIIQTKDILKFRTNMYKQYNTHRRPPIPPNNLRILFYHKYTDIEATDLRPDIAIQNYKNQTIHNIPSIGKYYNADSLALMSGTTNLDDLCREERMEEINACLQAGKTLTLIRNDEPDLMEAYIKSVDNRSLESSRYNYISIVGLAAVLALVTPSGKKTNTQPTPIAGPKDNIHVIVNTQSA